MVGCEDPALPIRAAASRMSQACRGPICRAQNTWSTSGDVVVFGVFAMLGESSTVVRRPAHVAPTVRAFGDCGSSIPNGTVR